MKHASQPSLPPQRLRYVLLCLLLLLALFFLFRQAWLPALLAVGVGIALWVWLTPSILRALSTNISERTLKIRSSASLPDRVELIKRAAQQVMFAPDRSEALSATCVAAMELCGGDAAAVYLIERGRYVLRQIYQANLTPEQSAEWMVLDDETLPKIFENPPSVVKASDPQRSAFADKVMSAGYEALVQVPLQSGALDIGLMLIFARSPMSLDRSRANLLQILATQLSSFLDNNDLFRVLESYAFEMAQLSHLSRVLTSSLLIEQIAVDVTPILSDMLNATQVSICVFENGAFRELRTPTSPEPPLLFTQAQLPEVQAAFAKPTPGIVFASRPAGERNPNLRALMSETDNELAIVPLHINQRLLGAIVLRRSEGKPFDERDSQLLEMAAHQLAVQVQNVLLYQETQHELNRRLEQLSLIEDIARRISSALQLDGVIEQVLEAALRATGADLASITLIAPPASTDEVWTVIQRNRQGETRRTHRQIATRDPIISAMQRARHPQLVDDLMAQPQLRAPQYAAARALAAVPLEREETLIGVLHVEAVEPTPFTSEQVGFLTSLAGHAVIGLENARLLEERQYQINVLRNLQSLAVRLSGQDDIYRAAAAIIDTAQVMLNADEVALFRYHTDKRQLALIHASTRAHETESLMRLLPQGAMRAAQAGEIKIHERTVGTGTLINVPIKTGEQVTEVLSLLFQHDRSVQQRDMNSLLLLASQAGGHLENARLQEAIRASRDRLSVILQSTRDGVILLDRDGRMIECNASAEHLIGFDRSMFIGKHLIAMLQRLMNEDETQGIGLSRSQLTGLARQLRLEPERITRREFQRAANGQMLYIEEIGSPVRNEQGQTIGRLLVYRDVTEQRQLAEYRDEISGMVVHDLRGPLWAIKSGITLAQDDIRENATLADTYNLLDAAADSANHMMALIESMLDISRLEKRSLPITREPVPLHELMISIRANLDGALREAHITFDMEVDANLPPLDVDRDLTRRVLVNLFDNAIKHTPAEKRILVTAKWRGRDAIIRVADSGDGIPAGERERIFERYRQIAGQSQVRGSKGSGLGLTFCKLVVEAHGGTIWVDSQSPLSGACFSFTLPVMLVSRDADAPAIVN